MHEEGKFFHEQIVEWKTAGESSTRCLPTHKLVSWKTMLWDMWAVGKGRRHWSYFHEMWREGLQSGTVIFVRALKMCARAIMAPSRGRVCSWSNHSIGSESNVHVCSSCFVWHVCQIGKAWGMLGDRTTMTPHATWCLKLPCRKDMACMGA